MIRGKYLSSMGDISEALDVRSVVFGIGRDVHDDMCIYAVAFDEDDTLSGCGRLYIDEFDHFRIDTVGVLAERRGRYLGDLLMRMLLSRAQELNAASVYLDSPETYQAFFERYGLRAISRENDTVRMKADAKDVDIEGHCH